MKKKDDQEAKNSQKTRTGKMAKMLKWLMCPNDQNDKNARKD